MNIKDILQSGRQNWGDLRMTPDHIAVAMGTMLGDICRNIRDSKEGELINEQELKKELGNFISSTIRWCDDLGYDPEECIRLSQEAQKKYVERKKSS